MKITPILYMPLFIIGTKYWPLVLYFCLYNKWCIYIFVFWWKVIAIQFIQWRVILSCYWFLPIQIHISCSHTKSSTFLAEHYSSFSPQMKSFTALEYRSSKENGDAINPSKYSIRTDRHPCLHFQIWDSLFDICQNTHFL